MLRLAERHVSSGVGAIEIESIGVLEHAFVAIGRAETHMDHRSLRQLDAADLRVAGDRAVKALRWRFKTQNLLDEGADLVLFRAEPFVDGWISEHEPHS